MGNCAGYCISENPDNKRKITVEQKEGESQFQSVAYIDEQRQEFEIKYGQEGEQRQFGSNTKGQ
jgi:hypothetical protein